MGKKICYGLYLDIPPPTHPKPHMCIGGALGVVILWVHSTGSWISSLIGLALL